MVRWAGASHTRYHVGKDGRTAYERMRGRKCNVPVAPIGEKVFYKEMKNEGERRNKLDTKWNYGI